jgi:hypothetical protein
MTSLTMIPSQQHQLAILPNNQWTSTFDEQLHSGARRAVRRWTIPNVQFNGIVGWFGRNPSFVASIDVCFLMSTLACCFVIPLAHLRPMIMKKQLNYFIMNMIKVVQLIMFIRNSLM